MNHFECVIFTGIQASGKTSYYLENFFDTHVHISLDRLRTRNRERIILEACLSAKQSFVIDNTNPRREDRARYIGPSLQAQFRIIGYYFDVEIQEALRRNRMRKPGAIVPDRGILSTQKKLEIPDYEEGYAELHHIRLTDGKFEERSGSK